jgi:hypothetical protein
MVDILQHERGRAMNLTRKFERLAVLMATAVVLLTAPAPASAVGTLDQSQSTTTGSSASVGGSVWWAQTFTAGITGKLDQVDLFLFRVGNPGDLTVQIQQVSGGAPSGAVLSTSTVAEASVTQAQNGTNSSSTWVSVPFSAPAPVTSGTQYAIVLSASGAAGINFYGWGFGSSFSPYSGGKSVLSLTGASTWGDFAFLFDSWDTAFKTYVTSLPTSIADCLNGGWTTFAAFKNEGDCVSFVATGGRNQPS